MLLLGLDIGSSSVKAGLLKNGQLQGRVVRESFPTHYDAARTEVQADSIARAVAKAIGELGARAKRADTIALATMAPSWVAMDKRGRAITPVVTHQDRRSVVEARELERRIGKSRHLKLVGNRPTPGGISSTTWAWFHAHHRSLMRRADLVGHVNTFLHHELTGARVTDPSHASLMGLFDIRKWGWNDEVMEAVGATEHQLPQIIGADGLDGMVTRAGGRRFGLTHGTPVLAGFMDTGGAVMLAGTRPGTMVNVSGSTDVLALVTDGPRPHERLITRALGVGRTWLSVSTLAAAGSTLNWVRENFFADWSTREYEWLVKRMSRLAVPRAGRVVGVCSRPARGAAKRSPDVDRKGVEFAPYLAGDRMSIEQRTGTLTGLTLSTTREQVLAAVIDALARASAERLDLLHTRGVRIDHRVLVSGGVSDGLGRVLHRDWKGRWRFFSENEASLRGLAKLI